MASNYSDHAICHDRLTVKFGQPITSAVMFAAGVVGNILALVLLEVRRRKRSPSLFQVLVTALVMTDLLGTFAVSPVVLVSYSRNRTLVGMVEGKEVCNYFGFSMTFLSLATLGILCVMALERYLSIGQPYFYERHFSKRCGYFTIPLIYLICVFFCIFPFMGIGSYVQYCPGTWCFLEMNPSRFEGKLYAGLYTSFTLIMILTTVICNIMVIHHLVLMDRKRKAHRSGVTRHLPICQRRLSMSEELEHLLLLVFITVAFVFCSLPMVLRVFMNFTGKTKESHAEDLEALRLLSFNSIIDPWVFIIFSPSVLRFFWSKLRRPRRLALAEEKPDPAQLRQLQPSPLVDLTTKL
ncbi:prostaglandin E receptor 2b subtype EP2 [Aplochiton taeniatus]